MKIDPEKEYAVLTGDIVASSALPKADRRRLAEVIRAAGQRVVARFPDAVPQLPDVFRGDSWQMLVSNPALAVRVALIMRLSIRAALPPREADSRVAIGVGLLDFLPKKGITGGDGEAFRLSGRGLEEINGQYRRLNIKVAGGRNEGALQAILAVLDGLMARWTKKQSGLVAARLEGLKQEEVAASTHPPISQPTAARQLRAAGVEGLEQALGWIEVSNKAVL